ncbi:MAG TPA: hypothetical protein VEY09_14760 [Pyrinomonadaceae bacterium]|nr:hypothetical protein [Pyrinomonadaceae bacterium]
MESKSAGPRRLYALALYATRPAPGAPEGYEHEVYLRVALAVAAGEEEARARTMGRLLELCPPAEGWMNHHVTLNHVPADALREALAALEDGANEGEGAGGEGAGEEDWPELLT